jgi:hypothetical protein
VLLFQPKCIISSVSLIFKCAVKADLTIRFPLLAALFAAEISPVSLHTSTKMVLRTSDRRSTSQPLSLVAWDPTVWFYACEAESVKHDRIDARAW